MLLFANIWLGFVRDGATLMKGNETAATLASSVNHHWSSLDMELEAKNMRLKTDIPLPPITMIS